jgi:hypothetical protein
MAAPIILLDAQFTVNAVVYPNTNVAIAMSQEAVSYSESGNTTASKFVGNTGGLISWTVEAEVNEEAAAFFTLFTAGVPTPIKIKAKSSANSTTNPQWTGEALLVDYSPLQGSHGEANKVSLSFVGSGELTRVIV